MTILVTALLAGGAGLLLGLLFCTIRHRRTQKSSQDLAMRYERILEGTGAGTWEWNLQTGETHFNEHWAQMLGYTAGTRYLSETAAPG